MGKILTFDDLIEKEGGKTTAFEPDYTNDFCAYMKESIRQSEHMSREAMNSAATIVICQ